MWIKRREQFARLARSRRDSGKPPTGPTDEPGVLWDPFRDSPPPS